MRMILAATMAMWMTSAVALGTVDTPPKPGMCFFITFYVEKYGADLAYTAAATNQWYVGKVNAACRCLDYQPAQCRALRKIRPVSLRTPQ